jgi:mono/diheme cytochrome c family protein
VLNEDIDIHQLVRLAGPTIALGEALRMNQQATLTFRRAGLNKLWTQKMDTPGMPEVEAAGPDNTFAMVVVVRARGHQKGLSSGVVVIPARPASRHGARRSRRRTRWRSGICRRCSAGRTIWRTATRCAAVRPRHQLLTASRLRSYGRAVSDDIGGGRMIRLRAFLAVTAVALGVAGCGGGGEETAGTAPPTTTAPTTTAPTTVAPTTVEAGDVAAGRQFFQQTCQACHFQAGQAAGGAGPRLADRGLSAQRIRQQVVNGGGGMPAGLAQGENLDNVVAYVLSIQ